MKLLTLLTLLFGLAHTSLASAAGNTDAAMIKVKVYKFAVSLSPACTHPITIFSDSTGVERDLLASPTFGSGQLAAGTYPCVLIEVSKVIHTKGTTACTTEWADVICNNDQLSQLIDGTAVTCTGDSTHDQHVTLFINTLSSSGRIGERALLPPRSEADTESGLKLTSPFIVSSTVSGTLKVNPTHFITSTSCSTNAPTFSFE